MLFFGPYGKTNEMLLMLYETNALIDYTVDDDNQSSKKKKRKKKSNLSKIKDKMCLNRGLLHI